MDHKAFLAKMDPDIRAEMTAKSDAHGLLHLAGHLGAIGLCGGLITIGVPGWWALLPLQGVLIAFLFTLEHECTHRTPFAHERLNDWVGRVCGLALVLPFEWFRWFHLAHHRWTNLPGKDPELASEKPATREEWVWPAVPFHKLPQVHALMRDELRVTAKGYAAFTREFLVRRRGL